MTANAWHALRVLTVLAAIITGTVLLLIAVANSHQSGFAKSVWQVIVLGGGIGFIIATLFPQSRSAR